VVVVMHFVRLRRSDGIEHSLLLFCARKLTLDLASLKKKEKKRSDIAIL